MFARFLSLILVSITLSAGLFAWGISLVRETVQSGYAALVFDETVPDREIRERLENKGFSGIISESGQRLFLDVFHGLEYILLDEFNARILPVDPRNDGFAEKLRSLFLYNGKRYVYFSTEKTPLGKPPVRFSRLENLLKETLYGFSFSIEAPISRTPVFFFFAVFAAAIILFFAVRPLRTELSPDAVCLIPLLPVVAPLAFGGAAAFAASALLAGFAVLLAQYFRESRSFPQQNPFAFFSLAVLLPAAYIFIAFFSSISTAFAFGVFGVFCFVFIFSLRLASATATATAASSAYSRHAAFSYQPKFRIRRRRRFMPVQIITPRPPPVRFAPAMIPFTVAAFAAAFLTTFFPAVADFPPAAPSAASFPPPHSVTEEAWKNHFFHQATFSFRSLHVTLPLHEAGEADGFSTDSFFLEHGFSPDGLVVQLDGAEGERGLHMASPQTAAPPFSLAGLLPNLEASEPDEANLFRLLYALVPLFFIIIAPIFRRLFFS